MPDATSTYLNRRPRGFYDALTQLTATAIRAGDADRVSFLNKVHYTELTCRVDSTEKRALARAARAILGISWDFETVPTMEDDIAGEKV